jgi:hypothetical protein
VAALWLAGKLGTTLSHILAQHSMWKMTKAFDPSTGLPYKCAPLERAAAALAIVCTLTACGSLVTAP